LKRVPKRAKRRQQAKRIKKRAKDVIKSRGDNNLSGRNVGRTASVHGAACSCMMCGNPRRKWGWKTLQEVKEDQIERDQKKDLNEDD
jgi:hypothetical protein